MKIFHEAIRKIDWSLLAIIACAFAVCFLAARIGSVSRDASQSDELRRVESKIDGLIERIEK